MHNRLHRIIILLILLLSVSLTACQPDSVPSSTSDRTQISTGEDTSQTQTATPAQTSTATVMVPPTTTPTLMPSPTPTQPWTEVSFAQTPIPELAGPIGTDNSGAVALLAIWGNGSVNGISLSPDGQILAVETNLGVTFYDSISYAQLAQIPTSLPVQSIAFSPDNLLVALGLSDGSIEIIDRATFRPLVNFAGLGSTLFDANRFTTGFSTNSKELFQVIEAEERIQVRRWQIETSRLITDFSLNAGWTIYVNADLDLLGIITNEDLALQSLKYVEENDLLDLPSTIADSFWMRMVIEGGEVAASSDGDFILINNGVAIALWELLSYEYTYLLDDYPSRIPDPCSQAPDSCLNTSGGFSWSCDDNTAMNPIELITLTPDNIMVLISRNDNLTEFRRVSDGLMPWEIEATFTDIAFSPGGEFFFGLRSDGTIEKRSTLDGTLVDFLNLHPSRMFDIAFSADGSVLAAGYSDGWIRVFSAANGEMLGVLTGTAQSLEFSPDGALLAAGLINGAVRLFDLAEGTYFDINPGHMDAVTALAFSSSGDLLLTGSADCTTSLWNIAGRYRVQTKIPSGGAPIRISQVVLGLDELTEFISGNRDGLTMVNELNTETLLLADKTIMDIALAPDGFHLAAVGESGRYLASLDDEFTSFTWLDDGRETDSFAVTFDGSSAILADATLTEIRLWSITESTFFESIPIAAFVSADNPPETLAFSPDGRLLVLATADGLIQVFGIPADTGN